MLRQKGKQSNYLYKTWSRQGRKKLLTEDEQQKRGNLLQKSIILHSLAELFSDLSRNIASWQTKENVEFFLAPIWYFKILCMQNYIFCSS